MRTGDFANERESFDRKEEEIWKREETEKMARNGGEGENAPPARLRARSGADPVLVVCGCFKFVTAIAALLCICVNILSAVRSFRNGSDIFDGIFRCYAVLIASFVVLAETEWDFILNFSKVLEYWAGRGMLQIFVAVMTRAYPEYTGERKALVLFQDISSYMLLSCGLLYLISGISCIGHLKRARQNKEISKEQAAKDLEELERRRAELEQLLVPGRF